ncbi:sigma-70 family RNA polymerase sigma factor [Microbacterium sp. BK668]|uniref:sigma-70 family RNA polymerase sigma factor n=1 Tax=Microbacterium sp. BK668 TaxID=2512118 RepID=UPI00105F9903|nr:sigma-70 family RNA polymerase sigma factor [Microbacterium sp. BK668]
MSGFAAGSRAGDARVLENMGLARRVARRFFRAGTNRDDDLVQVAYIGLVKAAQRFEPARGTDFAAYAVPTISGEIKRHLRDHGWFVRPPRAVQELRLRIGEVAPRLTQTLGHRPSLAELATELDEPVDRVREAIDSGAHLRPLSLDAPVGDDADDTLGSLLSRTTGEWERAELGMLLWAALRRLSPRDRRVVQLRFFEDCTQDDIAARVGVTQMTVSRILTRTLRALREDLQEEPAWNRRSA